MKEQLQWATHYSIIIIIIIIIMIMIINILMALFSRYLNKIETMPMDISYAPRVFIIGLPKSGKSSVAKM